MQNKLHIIIFLIICLNIKAAIWELEFCCCIFSKDPFRGFQSTSSDIFRFNVTNFDKEEIGNKLLSECLKFQGFPSNENINRIQKKYCKVEKDACEKECTYSLRELNEIYNVKQEENRAKEAKIFREKRRKLLTLLDKKIMENVNSFHKGKKCNISIKTKRKELKDMKQAQLPSVITRGGAMEQVESNEISFDSATSFSQQTDNMGFEDFNLFTYQSGGPSSNFIPTIPTIFFERNDLDIEQEIEKLDNQIMYFERKNKRPIDFILDRFSMQDDILVMIIKIFESTLEDVIRKMRDYFKDTFYFQFKIAGKFNNHNHKKI